MVWDADSGLWGATGSGDVYHADNGESWERGGALPVGPHAFLAAGATLYAAADADEVTGIYRSSDGGAAWHLLYRDDPA